MLDSPHTPPPRIKLRTLQKNYTRNQLISVARKLFLKRGVDGTTIGDISSAAGTSRATFYSHFPSKDTFIAELWQDLWRDLCMLNTRLSQAEAWSRPVIADWLGCVSSAWSEHARVLGYTLSHPAAKFYDTLTSGLNAEVEKLIESRQWDGYAREEARRRCYLLLLQLHQSMEALHCKGWKADGAALMESLAEIWTATCAYGPAATFTEGRS